MHRARTKSLILIALFLSARPVFANHALLKKQDSDTIVVLSAITWHGDQIQPHNLAALAKLRRLYPGTHALHLIDPAYWTKKNANKPAVTAKIRSVVLPGDEIGMLLQPWRSLLQAAGVKPIDTPTLWGQDVDAKHCEPDCGREVPLTSYTSADIDKLIKTSIEQFAAAGLSRPRTVQLAGWLSSDAILEALARNEFTTDFSAIPPSVVKSRLHRYPIFSWLMTRWQTITPQTPARSVETSAGKIVQGVATTAAMEFTTPKQLVDIVTEADQSGSLRNQVIFVNINQETAAEHLPRWRATMMALQSYADANKLKLKFLTLPLAF